MSQVCKVFKSQLTHGRYLANVVYNHYYTIIIIWELLSFLGFLTKASSPQEGIRWAVPLHRRVPGQEGGFLGREPSPLQRTAPRGADSPLAQVTSPLSSQQSLASLYIRNTGCFSWSRKTTWIVILFSLSRWWVTVLGFQGCCNKVPQTGCFKPQKFILWVFWRLEVWNPGVGRFGSLRRFWGRLCSVPVLASGVANNPSHSLPCVRATPVSSLCVSVSLFSLPIRISATQE